MTIRARVLNSSTPLRSETTSVALEAKIVVNMLLRQYIRNVGAIDLAARSR